MENKVPEGVCIKILQNNKHEEKKEVVQKHVKPFKSFGDWLIDRQVKWVSLDIWIDR